MDGHDVKKLKAAPYADYFITVTGNKNVIHREHMQLMKNGAI